MQGSYFPEGHLPRVQGTYLVQRVLAWSEGHVPGVKGIETVLPRTNSRVFCRAWGRLSSDAELTACQQTMRLRKISCNVMVCRDVAAHDSQVGM